MSLYVLATSSIFTISTKTFLSSSSFSLQMIVFLTFHIAIIFQVSDYKAKMDSIWSYSKHLLLLL